MPDEATAALARLYRRPGFLLRRAHQLSVGILTAEAAPLGLSPAQLGTLVVARAVPGLDQTALGQALGYDRATTGEILAGLEKKKLVVRAPSPTDRRRRIVALTKQGAAVLDEAGGALRQAQDRLMAPLSKADRVKLTDLLEKLCDAFNDEAKVKLVRPKAAAMPPAPGRAARPKAAT